MMRCERASACLIAALVGVLLLPALSAHAQGPELGVTFDDPALPGWERSDGVTVVDGVLHVEPGNFALYQGGEWGDMHLSIRVRMSGSEGVIIGYRTTDAGAYHVAFCEGGLVLQREASGKLTELGSATLERVPLGEWVEIEIVVSSGEHRIVFNGVRVITAIDPDPLPAGGVLLAVGEAAADFDDLHVTAIGGQLPDALALETLEASHRGVLILLLASAGLVWLARAVFRKRWPHPSPALRRGVGIGAVILATLAVVALAFYARWASPGFPPALLQLEALELDPGVLGIAMQGVAIPVVLIYILSTTRAFRQAVGKEVAGRDALQLFAGFAVALVLAEIVSLELARLGFQPLITLNLVVLLAGGMIGGWKVGLGLGLISMFIRGAYDFVPGFVVLIGEADLSSLFQVPWERVLVDSWVTNLWASVGVWAGGVAGLCVVLLGRWRFSPFMAAVWGAGLDLIGGYLVAITGGPPGYPFLLVSMLAGGAAMAAVALIARGVQADVARREATAAGLARAQAELRALRAQINPHFLFNAINTIRYFVRTDPETARRLLLNLSEVFQRALRSGEFVPLRDELSYVEAYLALEKARLGDRLQATQDVRNEDWLDHPVPTLILQPIVENAVVHGVAEKPEGGTVRIAVGQQGDELVLQVEDDGPGIPPGRLAEVLGPAQAGDTAVGLRNVDGRLRALYGEGRSLVIWSEVGRGTRVEIRIPVEG